MAPDLLQSCLFVFGFLQIPCTLAVFCGWAYASASTGPAGPISPILMPFASSQVGTQTIPDQDGKVVFEKEYTTLSGIAFNGTNTFTVGESGIYVLQCVLNLSPENTEASAFSLYVNGYHLVVSGAESGQIMIEYVGHLNADSEIQILNANYGKSTKVSQVYGFQGSAGHIIIYKIADSGVDVPS